MIEVVSPKAVFRRRMVFLAANVATYGAMLAAFAHAVPWRGVSAVLFAALAVFLPWAVLGLWNAVTGLALLSGRSGAARVVNGGPVDTRTAIIMTVRNEDPSRAVADFHTAFNLIVACVFLPLLKPFAALLRRLLPARVDAADPSRPMYLDPAAHETPVVALGGAAREALRLSDVLEAMLHLGPMSQLDLGRKIVPGFPLAFAHMLFGAGLYLVEFLGRYGEDATRGKKASARA